MENPFKRKSRSGRQEAQAVGELTAESGCSEVSDFTVLRGRITHFDGEEGYQDLVEVRFPSPLAAEEISEQAGTGVGHG